MNVPAYDLAGYRMGAALSLARLSRDGGSALAPWTRWWRRRSASTARHRSFS